MTKKAMNQMTKTRGKKMTEPTPQPPAGKNAPPARIRFIIDCDMLKGEVQVQGPIQQKLLAIKILADAIHIVTDYKPAPPPVIVDPRKANGHPLIQG